MPQRRQIVRQRKNPLTLFRRQLLRAILCKLCVFDLQTFIRAHGFISATFKFACHRSVIRIDGIILPPCLFDFAAQSSESLKPILQRFVERKKF